MSSVRNLASKGPSGSVLSFLQCIIVLKAKTEDFRTNCLSTDDLVIKAESVEKSGNNSKCGNKT